MNQLPDDSSQKITATVKASNHWSLATLARAGFSPDNEKGAISNQIRLSRMR